MQVHVIPMYAQKRTKLNIYVICFYLLSLDCFGIDWLEPKTAAQPPLFGQNERCIHFNVSFLQLHLDAAAQPVRRMKSRKERKSKDFLFGSIPLFVRNRFWQRRKLCLSNTYRHSVGENKEKNCVSAQHTPKLLGLRENDWHIFDTLITVPRTHSVCVKREQRCIDTEIGYALCNIGTSNQHHPVYSVVALFISTTEFLFVCVSFHILASNTWSVWCGVRDTATGQMGLI